MYTHLPIGPHRFKGMTLNISKVKPTSIFSKDEINMFKYEIWNLK